MKLTVEPLEDRRLLADASLVLDVNATTPNSNPVAFTTAGNRVFFLADHTDGNWPALYVTDGTAGGTQRLKTIGVTGSVNAEMVAVGDDVYFMPDFTSGAVWRSDGTPQGTVPVTNFPHGARVKHLRAVGETVYFVASGVDAAGEELYKLTDTGAVVVKDLTPTPGASSFPSDLTSFAGALYFFAADGTGARGLYRSDGTADGTQLVELVGTASARPASLIAAGAKLYFAVPAAGGGAELWTSDGSAEGTAPVELVVGPGGSALSGIVAAGNVVYFGGSDATNGRELWRSDGTADGTYVITNVAPGATGAAATPLAVLPDGTVLFGATPDGTVASRRLYRTDGTSGGTFALAGAGGAGIVGNPTTAVLSGAAAYVIGGNLNSAAALWRTDGTNAGTTKVTQFAAPPKVFASQFQPVPPSMAPLPGGKVAFVARDARYGVEPFASDGTAAGTVLLRDIDARVMSAAPREFTRMGDALFFNGLVALDNGPGYLGYVNGLYRTDGTAAGTRLVLGGPSPRYMTALGSTLVFQDDTSPGPFLWRSDGTTAGTTKIHDVRIGDPFESGTVTAVFNGYMYFCGAVGGGFGNVDWELWRTDGTTAGTTRVADIAPGTTGSSPFGLSVSGGKLFFFAYNGTNSYQLFVSDGTAAGTRRAKENGPPGYSAHASTFDVSRAIDLNGLLLFSTRDNEFGKELWRSDGTDAGTYRVSDIRAGSLDGLLNPQFTKLGDKVAFAAYDGTGHGVWITDGTAAGTQLLRRVENSFSNGGPQSLTNLGGELYFSTYGAAIVPGEPGGYTIWRSDGTSAGTAPIKTIPSDGGRALSDFRRLNGRNFFIAAEPGTGAELWETDGTAGGTVRLTDTYPGATHGVSTGLTVFGDALVFAAADPAHGTELWRMDVPPPVPPQNPYKGTPFAVGATPVTIQAEDYDLGGEGVAFHDTTPTNIGGLYRPSEAVDIKSQASGQYRISDAVAGEWLEYTIDVAAAGNYELEFRVSHADPNSKVHAEIDGVNVTGSMTVPDTNSHNTFTSVKKTVALTAGRHVLRFAWDANAANGYSASFDWIKVTKLMTPEPPPPGAGATIVSTIGAYVRNGAYASQNFGSASDLIVKRSANTGNTRETYLKFDLASLATVNSAKLRLHGRLSDTQNASVLTRIYSASNTSWSESGLTWNNKPASGTTVRGSLTVSGTTAAWYEVDLTSFLKAEFAAGRKVVTLVLKNPNTSDAQTVFSSDETANGPRLVVT